MKKKSMKILIIILFPILFFQSLIILIFVIKKINIKLLFDKNFLIQYKNYNLMKNFFNNSRAFQNYNLNFAIITRNFNCSNGLFGYYVAYISCLHKYCKRINNPYFTKNMHFPRYSHNFFREGIKNK